MIYRRVAARLRAQDWLAITIEVAIVIVGVFIGTQVSNWNEDRLARREADRMLVEVKPVFGSFIRSIDTAVEYFRVTGAYAKIATAGWNGDPSVSDEQFVIAAYQAGQIYLTGLSGNGLGMLIGSDRLRNITDAEVRDKLTTFIIMDIPAYEAPLATDYRKHLRQVIPEEIQDAIRVRCGTRRFADHYFYVELTPKCDLLIADAEFHNVAAELRRRPDIRGELRGHGAIVASYVRDAKDVKTLAEQLLTRLDRLSIGKSR